MFQPLYSFKDNSECVCVCVCVCVEDTDFSLYICHFGHYLCMYVCKFLATFCGIWDPSLLTGDRSHAPCSGRRSLNHRIAKEVLGHNF